jgi:bacterioferritin-associated ferredoxin
MNVRHSYYVILCHCNVVSDRQVRAAIDQGACDVDEVKAACAAGGDCGQCAPAIDELLDERWGSSTSVLLRVAS